MMDGRTASVAGSPSLWDTAPATVTDDALTESASTAPTSLSAESAPTSSSGPAFTFAAASPYIHHPNQPTRGLPIPASQARRRRERQRQQHARPEAQPPSFDSVDHWIHFDGDESASSKSAELTAFSSERQKPSSGRPLDRAMAVTRRLPPSSAAAHLLAHLDTDALDDSALVNALSDEDESLSLEFSEHLSTPLPGDLPPDSASSSAGLAAFRWETLPMAPLAGSLDFVQSATLTEAEQRRLMEVVLGPSARGAGGFGTTSMSQVTSVAPHPRPTPQRRPSKGDKSGGGGSGGGEARPSGDRTAHNDIERKYRTNLKDKIAELRDAVPALKAIPEDLDDEGGTAATAPKVSKGTVLTKATEYIRYLERKNKQMTQQHRELSKGLQAFEQLLSPQARSTVARRGSRTFDS